MSDGMSDFITHCVKAYELDRALIFESMRHAPSLFDLLKELRELSEARKAMKEMNT